MAAICGVNQDDLFNNSRSGGWVKEKKMKKDQKYFGEERNKEVSSPYHFYLFVRRVEKKMAILNTGHSNETNIIMINREFVASA